ncbi:prophage tail fiber N-terminal domain-containing protein [Escherichia coli]|uniref:prophage tail fiber N-terminal domain-containing protein n=1 Tax=Escherichia coli TaxID=562 RepID=UPI001BB0BB0D|nr:prophage tail fiber N-terminal domain-containing protein [Escherichia coli]
MAVKISGVLKDGTGKPVQNCTIQLKAKRNSTTVVERRHRKTGTELHNPAESKT